MSNPVSPQRFPKELLVFRPGKWDLVVVASLGDGTLRFNALRAEIGDISQKMLSSTLRELERNGFVSRTQYPSIPPRVEYDLTVLGRELLAFAQSWADFIRTHQTAVLAAREAFEKNHDIEPQEFKHVG